MTKSKLKGNSGEDAVAKFLEKKNYKILQRNFYSRYGEVDIIARDDRFIAFVEVKTRKENALVSALESVTISKQEKIKKTAMVFFQKYECDLQPRFDVAEVISSGDRQKINYIPNAF